jgi:hypothetical protein
MIFSVMSIVVMLSIRLDRAFTQSQHNCKDENDNTITIQSSAKIYGHVDFIVFSSLQISISI